MTARRLAVLVLLVVILAGCGASDDAGSEAASTTTTSTSTTTTTTPDPAVAGCKLLERGEVRDAFDQLVISRDTRIVDAAKAWDRADDPFGETDLGAVSRAITEMIRACQAAG
jgi:hypothetical protein